MKKQDSRTRNWTFVVYPESLPKNWIDILVDLHTNVIISPLHDKDINPDGSLKKPHYHILIQFESVKSYKQVLEISMLLNGVIPQPCNNTKGLVRYFIHLDNPEKVPYPKELIRTLGYVDLEEYFALSYTDKNLLMQDMIDLINEKKLFEFCDLVDYCRVHRRNDFLPFLTIGGGTYFIKEYLRSRRFSLK